MFQANPRRCFQVLSFINSNIRALSCIEYNAFSSKSLLHQRLKDFHSKNVNRHLVYILEKLVSRRARKKDRNNLA